MPFTGAKSQHRKHCRLTVAATQAADGGSGTGGSGGSSSEVADQRQQQEVQPPRRRELLLSSVQLAVLGAMPGSEDGRTILNSVLGAYGLPQLKATPGFRVFDDPEEPFTFDYPASWVRRKNTLRQGIIISDFNTADKMSLEVFPQPPAGASLAEAAVLKLINPAAEVGGNSRLELPPASRIRSEARELGGKAYTYLAFPSETITRSGYQVRRRHVAVAATRRGSVYVLGCSARSDQYDAAKERLFQHVVDSFRLL